jgi:flagellar protein FlaJ
LPAGVLVSKFTTAYREELKMPAKSWLQLSLVGTLAVVFIEWALIILLPWLFDTPLLIIPFLMIAPIMAVLMVFYPIFKWERRGSEIDREMHLFITRMGVLSASESARKEMFDILSKMREYRSLAVEINKIFILVDKWNVSLERACRFVAQTTPSEFLADFLFRLAHAVEGGEPAESFFQTEQVVVMNAYSVRYQSAMTSVEWWKEAFVSVVVAVLFILVVAAIAPFIAPGEDPNVWLAYGVAIFLVVEVIFLLVLQAIVPGENIWHNMALQTKTHVMIRRGLYSSVFLSAVYVIIVALIPPDGPSNILLVAAWGASCILLVVSTLFYPQLEPALLEGIAVCGILVSIFFIATLLSRTLYAPLAMAFIFTPWLVPGRYINVEEEKIKRRDDNFAAFLRSLGAAVAATSKDITVPLSKLRRHDFGPLSRNIDDLYKRLSLRILRPQAWEYYSAESLSELISKFTEMYVEGIKAGGSPKKVSQIISDNFLKIVGLRKLKYASSDTLTLMLYGLGMAVSFILYFTMVAMTNFSQMGIDLQRDLSEAGEGGLRISQSIGFLSVHLGGFDFTLFGGLVLFMLAAHSFLSAVMTRIISGGHRAGALWHFVLIFWSAALTGVLVLQSAKVLFPYY